MRKVIEALKVNDFIGEFGWFALKCIEKCECTLVESIRTYSSYYYLLFKEKRNGLLTGLNQQPDQFMEENLKIKFELKFVGIQNFLADIRRFIDNEERIMLINDTFYEELDHHYYQKQHHIHFIIPKGYDPEDDTYLLIDSDYSPVVNYTYGAKFMERTISARKLTELCCDVKSLAELKSHGRDIGADLSEGFYAFFRAIDLAKGSRDCDLHQIASLYEQQLTELIGRAKEIEGWFLEDVQLFIQNFDRNHSRSFEGQAFQTPVANLYTDELIRINEHTQSLGTQKKFFDLKMKGEPSKENIMRLFDNLINPYSIVLGLFRKSLEEGDKSTCDRVSGYLKGISNQEVQLYEALLKIADSYICRE